MFELVVTFMYFAIQCVLQGPSACGQAIASKKLDILQWTLCPLFAPADSQSKHEMETRFAPQRTLLRVSKLGLPHRAGEALCAKQGALDSSDIVADLADLVLGLRLAVG